MGTVKGSTKQGTARIGCYPVRSAIVPGSHLWFALAVSLVLHSLFLTALAVKSHWPPIYHPAMYGMGSGFSVVQFVSGTFDGSGKGAGSQDEDAGAPNAELPSSPSPPVEVSENPPPMEAEPVELMAVKASTSQEAQLTHDPVTSVLQPEPITAGAAIGEPSGVGSAADGPRTGGIDGEGSNRVGTGGGTVEPGGGGNSYGIPAYLRNPLPPYPRVAREHGWEGTTLLQVEVLDDGSGGNVEILKSSGHEVLDKAAVKTVRSWQFLPARSGDTPIRSLVEIPFRFRMAGN
jgi:protein TonB